MASTSKNDVEVAHISPEPSVSGIDTPQPSSSSAVEDGTRSTHSTGRKRKNRPSKLAKSAKKVWRRVDPSLILENTGSVARDHLASERTFLAYVRTSLAFASAGVALVQLFNLANQLSDNKRLSRYAQPLGATMVIFGMFVLSVGTMRYFTIQHAMMEGKFPAARFTVAIQALFLLVLVVVTFGFLIAAR